MVTINPQRNKMIDKGIRCCFCNNLLFGDALVYYLARNLQFDKRAIYSENQRKERQRNLKTDRKIASFFGVYEPIKVPHPKECCVWQNISRGHTPYNREEICEWLQLEYEYSLDIYGYKASIGWPNEWIPRHKTVGQFFNSVLKCEH